MIFDDQNACAHRVFIFCLPRKRKSTFIKVRFKKTLRFSSMGSDLARNPGGTSAPPPKQSAQGPSEAYAISLVSGTQNC